MNDRQLAVRILLTGIILTLGAMPLACAHIWPEEQGPSSEILASRYVTQEQREAVADLNSPEMTARMK